MQWGKVSLRVSLAVGLVLGASSAFATPVTLIDLNSVATFETETQAGQNGWTVDGQSQLLQQWFWFRIGAAPEQSLDSLPQTGISVVDANFNPGNDTLTAQHTGLGVQITTRYTLTGGSLGSGASDLAEQISIKNLTGSAMPFSFFQYVDFNLLGTAGNDSVSFVNPNTVVQSEGPAVLSETVNTTIGAASTAREVALIGATLAKLNDGFADNLNNNLGPVGPGDVTWAFQWDFVIPAGGTVLISKDKNLLVPEPASLALLGFGSLVLARRRRAA